MCKYWKLSRARIGNVNGERFSDFRRRTAPLDV
jgi:hypothetical protein